MDDLKKVVVFIPAFNEEENIGAIIERVREIYPESRTGPQGYIMEILVVDDGSLDDTEKIARSYGVEVIAHPKNKGLGAATRTAMDNAFSMGADVAVKLDADFQHGPEDIKKVISPILSNKADICWGSRFKGGIQYKMPLIRLWGNKFFTWLMNQLTDYKISDAQTGLMAFNRHYLSMFEMHGNYNPPQQLLIDANFKNMRYIEEPVTFHPRKAGKSFVTYRYPFHVISNILRAVIFGNPLKVFCMIGLGFILFSIFYGGVSVLALKFHWPIMSWFIPYLSLATIILGVQSVFFGILADLIIRKRNQR